MADIGKGLSSAATGAKMGATLGSIVPGVGNVVGGIIGGVGGLIKGLFGGGKRQPTAAELAADEYIQSLLAQGVPPADALKATYQRLQSQGELTPEMEETFFQADTELAEVEADPVLKEAQNRALESLRRTGEEQGLTLEDRIANTESTLATSAAAKGRNDAILQDMAAKGMSGAGAELALRAANEQAQAQTNALVGAKHAAAARTRALDSVLRGGEMAGNMRTQAFTEDARKAEAADSINKFNTANQQSVESRNVGTRNDAASSNLSNKQRIADANTGLTNKEADNSVQALKDSRTMALDQARSIANAKLGKFDQSQAADTAAANKSTATMDTISKSADLLNKNKDAIGEGLDKIKGWF